MNSVSDDPGSLSRLHDIVGSPPIPWWPPTAAWFILGVLVLATVGLLIAWWAVRWNQNWYRRAGYRELQRIEQSCSYTNVALAEVAELLKRLALVAYPREAVASITGMEWLHFLDRTADTTAFTTGAGRQLLLLYDRVNARPTPELFQLVRLWIRQHRRDAGC